MPSDISHFGWCLLSGASFDLKLYNHCPETWQKEQGKIFVSLYEIQARHFSVFHKMMRILFQKQRHACRWGLSLMGSMSVKLRLSSCCPLVIPAQVFCILARQGDAPGDPCVIRNVLGKEDKFKSWQPCCLSFYLYTVSFITDRTVSVSDLWV